jgi:hypothetical protein
MRWTEQINHKRADPPQWRCLLGVSEVMAVCSEDTTERWFTTCDECTTGGTRKDIKVYGVEKKLPEFHLLSDEFYLFLIIFSWSLTS